MPGIAKTTIFAASILIICGATNASAGGSLFPEDAPTVTYGDKRQEFGSGWYLRGDTAWSRDKSGAITADANFGPATQINLFSAGIGFGYKLNSWFRADVTADWRAPKSTSRTSATFGCPIQSRGLFRNVIDPITGAVIRTDNLGHFAVLNQCRAEENAKIHSGVVLLNGYFDLGTWAGVTPYVGAGVGVAYGRITGSSNWVDTASGATYSADLALIDAYPTRWLLGDGTVNPIQYNYGVQNQLRRISTTQFNFAFALMAGFAVEVSKHAKIDFGYRYLNMGKWAEGSVANTAHEVRIGFRYQID